MYQLPRYTSRTYVYVLDGEETFMHRYEAPEGHIDTAYTSSKIE